MEVSDELLEIYDALLDYFNEMKDSLGEEEYFSYYDGVEDGQPYINISIGNEKILRHRIESGIQSLEIRANIRLFEDGIDVKVYPHPILVPIDDSRIVQEVVIFVNELNSKQIFGCGRWSYKRKYGDIVYYYNLSSEFIDCFVDELILATQTLIENMDILLKISAGHISAETAVTYLKPYIPEFDQ